MTGDSRVFDLGLQPERTALAWRRTLLSLAAALIAGSRTLIDPLGLWSYVVAGGGLAVVALIALATERRYRASHRHLTLVDRSSLPHDGVLIVTTAAVTLLAGLAALLFVLGHAL